jgi:hypothetical protein
MTLSHATPFSGDKIVERSRAVRKTCLTTQIGKRGDFFLKALSWSVASLKASERNNFLGLALERGDLQEITSYPRLSVPPPDPYPH